MNPRTRNSILLGVPFVALSLAFFALSMNVSATECGPNTQGPEECEPTPTPTATVSVTMSPTPAVTATTTVTAPTPTSTVTVSLTPIPQCSEPNSPQPKGCGVCQRGGVTYGMYEFPAQCSGAHSPEVKGVITAPKTGDAGVK